MTCTANVQTQLQLLYDHKIFMPESIDIIVRTSKMHAF